MNQTPQKSNQKTCAVCGTVLSDGALFCPKCGQIALNKMISCANCGAKLKESDVNCPRCGVKLVGKHMPVVSFYSDDNSAGGKGAVPAAPAPVSNRPDLYRDAPTVGYFEEAEPQSVPAVALSAQSKAAPPAPKPAKKKTALVLVITFLVLLIIAAVVLLAIFNSEGYRQKRAVEAILNNDVTQAQEYIQNLDNEAVPALTQYLQLTQTKTAFLTPFNQRLNGTNEVLIKSQEDEIYTAAQQFVKEVKAFSNTEYPALLPEQLALQFNQYLNVANGIDGHGLTQEELCDWQMVLMDSVIKNTSETFTMQQMQENIDISQQASNSLNLRVKAVPCLNKKLVDSQSVDLVTCNRSELQGFLSLFQQMNAYVKNEIDFQSKKIQKDVEEQGWLMDDKLSLNKKDPDFRRNIGTVFTPVASRADMQVNANLILFNLYADELGMYLNVIG